MHSNTIKIIKQMDIIVNTEREKIGNSTENTHIKTFFCASFIKQTCCPVFIFSYSKKRRHKIKKYVRFLRTLQQQNLFSLFRNVPATRFPKVWFRNDDLIVPFSDCATAKQTDSIHYPSVYGLYKTNRKEMRLRCTTVQSPATRQRVFQASTRRWRGL